MRLSRRIKVVGGTMLAMLALAASWVGYRFLTHGPPAILRSTVSEPTARLHYGPNPAQTLDIRVPSGSGPFPVVVLIHGGCFLSKFGGPEYMAPIADALLRHGIASVNIGYRRIDEAGGGWPGTFRDVGTAVDTVGKIGARYRIDSTRVVVAGHSAGATLAFWSGTRGKLTASSDLHMASPVIPRAVVAIDGPGALARFIGADADLCGQPIIVPLMNGNPARVPQHFADGEPQDRLPLGVPQYIIRGGIEQPDDAYVAAARASGDKVIFVRPPGRVTHFDVLMPWQPQGKPALDLMVQAVSAVHVRAGAPVATRTRK